MKWSFAIAIAASLAACAPIATSQTIIARPLLNSTTIGGPGYPVIVHGAEALGLTAADVAQRLRFPARLRAGSSFRAVRQNYSGINRAALDLTPTGDRIKGTLTFLHGDRRIGVGTFTLPRSALAESHALGSASAAVIDDMLREARARTTDDDGFLVP